MTYPQLDYMALWCMAFGHDYKFVRLIALERGAEVYVRCRGCGHTCTVPFQFDTSVVSRAFDLFGITAAQAVENLAEFGRRLREAMDVEAER